MHPGLRQYRPRRQANLEDAAPAQSKAQACFDAPELRGPIRAATMTRKAQSCLLFRIWMFALFSYRRPLSFLHQVSAVQPQVPPVATRPRSFPNALLGFQKRSIARICLSRKLFRVSVLDDAAILDDERASKPHGLAHIVRDAEQGYAFPVLTSARQQLSPLMTIKTSKRFVEKSQANALFEQGTSKADALAFPTRNQTTAFSEIGLQSIGQFFKKLAQIGLLQ